MGKQITTIIRDFSGGISDDIREPSANKFSISKHFDIFSPHKLSPYRGIEDESPSAGNAIGNFLHTSLGELLGLGKVIGYNYPLLYWKTGANLITDPWGSNRNNWVGAQGIVQYPLFIEFNSYIYFCSIITELNRIVQATVNYTTAALNETYGTLSAVPTGQGLVHNKAAQLFIPCGNKIDRINSSNVFQADVAPSISSNLEITSLSEYGSYLGIGCRNKTGGNSKLIIWDMVSTTTFIDVIDFGSDSLYVLNNLEGSLIGISCTPSNIFIADKAGIVIRQWAGGKPSTLKEISIPKLGISNPSVTIYPRVNFVKDNKLYFSAVISGGSTPSASYIGLFAIGRKNVNYPYAVTLDRFATNDNSETSIIAAIIAGGICWTVHTAEGTVTRTNDQSEFLAISIYESQIFDGRIHEYDASFVKNLVEASLTCEKLPHLATATLKYRVDGATSWTTLLTISTETRLSEFINKSIGDYKEIEWRIESYFGAVITSFSFLEEVIGKKKQT